MLNLKLDKLLSHLKKSGLQAEIQKETNQIVIIFKILEREFPLFIRIFEGEELLQLLAFLPFNIKSDTVADTGRLLHLLNKELDIPGFGMDETSSVVFYRCMLPVLNKQIDETILDAFLNSIQLVCKSFAPVIAAVAHGSTTFEEVLKKTREQGNNKSVSQNQIRP